MLLKKHKKNIFRVRNVGNHNQNPAFTANWFSGEVKAPENSFKSFYHEGGGDNDSILIYGIKWQNGTPTKEGFNRLMDEAITAIDNWIAARF